MVRIKNVSYSYGERFSISDISLEIGRGEVTVLLGPNGSGKTTLLNLISGILKPQSGEVFLLEENIHQMKSKSRAKSIAVVRQFVNASFGYSVFDIVSMGRYAYKRRFEALSKDDIEIVRHFLREMGIEHLQNEAVNKISGGELQRVSLARALSQQSDVLLLDEPVNHLDIRHRYDILNTIKSRAERGHTALCVLHDIGLALKYADKLVLLKDGRLKKVCRTEEITQKELAALYDVTEQELLTMVSV
jgi:iron complex transport system ATP-binding protein